MLFGPKYKDLRLRQMDESKHFLVVGDTGVGKSQFIKQLLYYAQECGDTCIVLDSKLEFIPEFYNPKRGDKILSPKDDRCVYWDLGNEVNDETDAIGTMRAFYPVKPGSSNEEWFNDQACVIGAYLLTYSNPRPSCTEYGYWLAHPEEIFKRLKGSEHEQTLNKNAAPQLAAILGTMNKAGFAFRLMPGPYERDRRERFTIREYAQNPEGWLFLPNTAETRDALRPLQSGWADMAMLRIMSRQKQSRRVWIVLDELDSIGKLSKLVEGMAMLRSTGNPLVLGMQNPAQLEDRYGRQADTIFSQAVSKLIFAVSEPKSAKIMQDLIGEVEIRRYRESRSGSLFGRNDRNNYSGPEEIRKPLVLASEIQGLPDLRAYFLQRPTDKEVGLHVVPINIPWRPPVKHHDAIVDRAIPSMHRRPFEPEWIDSPVTPDPTPQPATGDFVKTKRPLIPVKASQQLPLEGASS